jgi:hypothetical protein
MNFMKPGWKTINFMIFHEIRVENHEFHEIGPGNHDFAKPSHHTTPKIRKLGFFIYIYR